MFDGLREKWRKSREIKAAKKAVYNAIDSGDAAGVKAALDALGDAPVDAQEKGWFLKRAIESHSLPAFKEVLSFVGDPNTEITYSITRNDTRYNYRYSPIDYAVTKICTHDISLWMANNPRTVISDDLMESAKKGGMQDVALVLTKRSAELRRQEAALLDKEASKPADAEIAAPLPAAAEAPAADAEWALVAKQSVAHVTKMEVLSRKITEIFNFETRERVIITENLKSGAETVSQPDSFDKIAPANVQRAADMLKSLTDGGPKRSFTL